MRRVIINCLTGSNRRFKRFESISISIIKRATNLQWLKIEFVDFQAEVADGNDNGDLELDFYEDDADKYFLDDR